MSDELRDSSVYTDPLGERESYRLEVAETSTPQLALPHDRFAEGVGQFRMGMELVGLASLVAYKVVAGKAAHMYDNIYTTFNPHPRNIPLDPRQKQLQEAYHAAKDQLTDHQAIIHADPFVVAPHFTGQNRCLQIYSLARGGGDLFAAQERIHKYEDRALRYQSNGAARAFSGALYDAQRAFYVEWHQLKVEDENDLIVAGNWVGLAYNYQASRRAKEARQDTEITLSLQSELEVLPSRLPEAICYGDPEVDQTTRRVDTTYLLQLATELQNKALTTYDLPSHRDQILNPGLVILGAINYAKQDPKALKEFLHGIYHPVEAMAELLESPDENRKPILEHLAVIARHLQDATRDFRLQRRFYSS